MCMYMDALRMVSTTGTGKSAGCKKGEAPLQESSWQWCFRDKGNPRNSSKFIQPRKLPHGFS